MGKRTYPRFGAVFKRYRPSGGPICDCCDERAVARVWIEVSYMRGDDEDWKVCDKHLAVAKTSPADLKKKVAA